MKQEWQETARRKRLYFAGEAAAARGRYLSFLDQLNAKSALLISLKATFEGLPKNPPSYFVKKEERDSYLESIAIKQHEISELEALIDSIRLSLESSSTASSPLLRIKGDGEKIFLKLGLISSAEVGA